MAEEKGKPTVCVPILASLHDAAAKLGDLYNLDAAQYINLILMREFFDDQDDDTRNRPGG